MIGNLKAEFPLKAQCGLYIVNIERRRKAMSRASRSDTTEQDFIHLLQISIPAAILPNPSPGLLLLLQSHAWKLNSTRTKGNESGQLVECSKCLVSPPTHQVISPKPHPARHKAASSESSRRINKYLGIHPTDSPASTPSVNSQIQLLTSNSILKYELAQQ